MGYLNVSQMSVKGMKQRVCKRVQPVAKQDPTRLNYAISVTFALNEPGTAYCRATRADSGEVAADMIFGCSYCE